MTKRMEVEDFVASIERDITKDGRIYGLGEWKECKAIVIVMKTGDDGGKV